MKRNIVIATVTAAALIGGGTVAAYASADDGNAPTQRQTSVRVADDDRSDDADDRNDDATDDRSEAADDRSDDATEIRVSKISAVDAIAAALKNTPGTAVSADRDDDGPGAWDVNVVKGDGTEYNVQVSPDTAKVVGAQRDDDDDSDGREDLAALEGASVDAREAAEAGAAKGTVTDVDLDDDGPAAWSVETTKGEWKVDLKTGKVTQDRDDDTAQDNAQDDRGGDDD